MDIYKKDGFFLFLTAQYFKNNHKKYKNLSSHRQLVLMFYIISTQATRNHAKEKFL